MYLRCNNHIIQKVTRNTITSIIYDQSIITFLFISRVMLIWWTLSSTYYINGTYTITQVRIISY